VVENSGLSKHSSCLVPGELGRDIKEHQWLKKSFPRLPITHWWALRKKFKQSIPGVVTDNYIATVLNMKVDSARANILPFLRQLGIIDDEGKTGERARLWRDDEHYPEVCKAILTEVYPDELVKAVPSPSKEREKAVRWFANETGTGEGAASQMAALYTVLVEADASKQPDQEKKERPKAEEKPRREVKVSVPAVSAHVPGSGPRLAHDPFGLDHLRDKRPPPEININLQVHISADATADQIDQIFASMAKHLYPRD